jgi:hypothetical protein
MWIRLSTLLLFVAPLIELLMVAAGGVWYVLGSVAALSWLALVSVVYDGSRVEPGACFAVGIIVFSVYWWATKSTWPSLGLAIVVGALFAWGALARAQYRSRRSR